MNKTVEERRKQLSSYWDNGPGPAGVMLPPTVGYIGHDPSRKRNPAYSLGLQMPSTLIVKGNGPGPIYSLAKGMTAKGQNLGLAYSLRGQTKVIENFNTDTPGPAAYLPEINSNRRRPPAYSMSWRTKLIERGQQSPGPIYLLPPLLGRQCEKVTIKGRGKTEDEHWRSPGPAYDIGSPCLIKPCPGAVTIKGRWKPLKSQSVNAGPGSYNVHAATPRIWRSPPAFSLGIRHSEFAGTLMTNCDKAADLSESTTSNGGDSCCS